MQQKELIDLLLADIDAAKTFGQKLASIDEAHLVQRPAEKNWCVLECLEHILIANGTYMAQYGPVIDGLISGGPAGTQEAKSTWFGKFCWNGMKPRGEKIPSPMKTFRKFLPEQQNMDVWHEVKVGSKAEVLDAFKKMQDDMTGYLEAARQVDINKGRVKTALGFGPKLRLGDALRFIIAHQERHILQAKHALNATL